MKRISFTFPQWAIIYIAVYFTFKIFSFIPFFTILAVGVFVALSVFIYQSDNRMGILIFKSGFLLALLFVLYALVIYHNFNISVRYYSGIDNVVKILLITFFMLCLLLETTDFRKKILKLCFWGYLLTMISTCINVIIDPGILRRSASTAVESAIVFGLGGYDFIYGIVIVNILLVDILMRRPKQYKWIFWLALSLNTLTVTISGYTTATIFNILFILLAVFLCRNSANLRYLLLLIPLIAIIYFVLPSVLTWASSLDFLPMITRLRLYGMGTDGIINYYMNESSRYDLMEISLELLKQHPLFGNFLGNPTVSYGEHTEWIDRLAQYGIIPFSIMITFWVMLYKLQKNYIIGKGISATALRICYVYFIILGFFNPCTYALTVFPLIVFVPFLYEIVEFQDNKALSPT